MKVPFYIILLSAGLFFSCNSWYYPHNASIEEIEITAQYDTAQNIEMHSVISNYKNNLDRKMDIIIGTTARELPKGKPESLLGNFIADILYNYGREITTGKVDFAVTNYGGLRIPQLPAGEVTRGRIFSLMPFDNYVVVLEIPGTVVRQFCNHIATYGGWPISRSVNFTIAGEKAINITIKGDPLVDEKIYQVATNNYIANGGDDCFFLATYEPIIQGDLLRNIIIEKFKKNQKMNRPVNAHLDNRITIK